MSEYIFALDINPEPWAVGPIGTARREGKITAYMGQNKQLAAYKEAVAESIAPQMEGKSILLPPFDLEFWFWRNHAEYLTPQARMHKKHAADTTNMQKATEDALQGILITNDRDTSRARSWIVAQGPDVRGAVLIRAAGQFFAEDNLPERIKNLYDLMPVMTAIEERVNANVWPPQG